MYILLVVCVCVFFTLSRRSLIACFLFVRFKSNSNSSPFLASSIFYLLEQVNFRFYTLLLLFSCFDLDFIVVVIVGDVISLLFLFTILLFSYSLFFRFVLISTISISILKTSTCRFMFSFDLSIKFDPTPPENKDKIDFEMKSFQWPINLIERNDVFINDLIKSVLTETNGS